MRTETLILLITLALPAAAQDAIAAQHGVNGLRWVLQMGQEFSSLNSIEVRATLHNVSGKPLTFRSADKRPRITWILGPEGGKTVRKPLPAGAPVYRGGSTLQPQSYAWLVITDLREVFGPLSPGRYVVQIELAAEGYRVERPGFKALPIRSSPVKLEVFATTLEDARKANKKAVGVDLKVQAKGKERVGILTNRRARTLVFWAYKGAPGRPLSAMVTLQSWTGRGWSGNAGGFCGTGLEQVTLAPGKSVELELPSHGKGIHRFVFDCAEQNTPKKRIVVRSDVVLVK